MFVRIPVQIWNGGVAAGWFVARAPRPVGHSFVFFQNSPHHGRTKKAHRRAIVWMIKRMIKGCPTESDAKASK
jgi:hypothetical protein